MADFTTAVSAISKFKAQFQRRLDSWPAYLGDGRGNLRNSDSDKRFILVRYPLQSSPAVEVLNEIVPDIENLRVMVGYTPDQPDVLRVLGRADSRTDNQALSGVLNHADQHAYLATDTDWVDFRRILTFRVIPAGGLTLYAYGGILATTNALISVPQQLIDLTNNVPASGARFVLITVSPTGVYTLTNGSTQPSVTALTIANIPSAPDGHFRLFAVILKAGQTDIVESLTRNDLIDLRWPNSVGDRILPNGKIWIGNASDVATPQTVSGDATLSNAGVLTLANSGVSAGSYGSASNVPQITVDAKGRLTAAANVAISIGAGSTSVNTANFNHLLSAADDTVQKALDTLDDHTHAHSTLTGIGANDHHNQSHALTGSDHTASGLTTGHVLRASGATTFEFAAIQDGDLPGSIARSAITITGTGALGGGGDLTANRTITLNTPGSLSSTSTNSSSTNHTHAIDSTIARSAITVTGTGALGGGGDLTANRTISMNTPGTLSVSSTNSATTNHTHAITSSSTPGAAASILATNASGQVTLTGLFTANGGVALGVQPSADSHAISRNYINSRMMNMVTNGTGLLGNNYNFSAMTFDSTETYAGGGSFKSTTGQTVISDEYIAVDPSRYYRGAVWLKNGNADGSGYNSGAWFYGGLAAYDIDGAFIESYMVMKYPGATDTTLSAPLNNGDTTMTVTDTTGWYNAGGSSEYYRRQIAWWPYTNSKGYSYPNYTYTRNVSMDYGVYGSPNGMWAAGGISGNTVTLTAPWPGPNLPAGTPVRNSSGGSAYNYFITGDGVKPPQNTWTRYEGYIGPMANPTGGWTSANTFRPGTAFIRLLFLTNFSGYTDNVQRISGIWLSEVSTRNLESATSTVPGVMSTSAQTFAGNKTFNNDVYALGSFGVGTASPSTLVHGILSNATTSAVDNMLTLAHTSSGTPANGFGGGIRLALKTSTTADTTAALIEWLLYEATHASRKIDLVFSAYDTAKREGLRIRGAGSAAALSFYGGTPVTRGAALTTQLTTITHTAPGTPDYAIQDLTDTGGFGFVTKDEGNSVLAVIANLQTRLAELEARLNSATGVNLIA